MARKIDFAILILAIAACTVREETGEMETRRVYNQQGEVTHEYEAPVIRERSTTGGEVAAGVVLMPCFIFLPVICQ